MTCNGTICNITEPPPAPMGVPDLFIGLGIGCIILFFIMFPSNLAVIIVFKKYLGFKNVTNIFIFSIAVSDFLMSFNLISQAMFFFNPSWGSLKYACLFRLELMTFLTNVTLLSGIFATIDRFVMICTHRYYQRIMTNWFVKCIVVFVWTYSFFYAALPFFGINDWERDGGRCSFTVVMFAWFIVWGILTHFIATAIEVVLYACILYTAYRRKRNTVRDAAALKKNTGMKSAKFMGIFLIIFTMCWMPFAIMGFFLLYSPSVMVLNIRMASVFLGLLNGAVNPAIYAWQRKDFRQGLRKLFNCNTCCQPDRPDEIHAISTANDS